MHLRKRERHELESCDEYARVVVRLSDVTRVIECRDSVQWIVQRAHIRNGKRSWDGVWFCRTKEALLRGPGVPRSGNAILDALPDWFPDRLDARKTDGVAEMAPTDSLD